uniref:Two pore domain potassium channel family protein n=1 Tax=Desulfobacca acetoxidans TaxID=60893 RepID=A0A7C3ZAI7_9BACT
MSQEHRSLIARLRESHSQQRYMFLFGGLLLLLVIAPIFQKSNIYREILAGITSIILLTGIYSVLQESRKLFIAGLFLAALNFATLWREYAVRTITAAMVHYVGLIIFFLFIIIIILRHISKETSINRNVIYGAVTVYLLIAFAWGLLFATVFLVDRQAFVHVVTEPTASFSPVPFWYLSFMTITTMGYNDIAPASDLAKSLAMIEAVVGQLYLVLQVSLLVGLRVSEVSRLRERK